MGYKILSLKCPAPRWEDATERGEERDILKIFPGFRKTNNRAIAGFLLPFVAAGLASVLVLGFDRESLPFQLWVPFVTVIPLILILGLTLSLKSVPFIEKLGDKDYAYSGLVLNIFFILFYIASVIYYLCTSSD
ncbi:MAG: hypothetical protein PVJ69_20520 [Desulfobacteraceae bacterium]|jgi:hypothetical protein